MCLAGTGNTVIEAVRVLIEHGVQPKHIILLSLFSTPHGNTAAQVTTTASQSGAYCLHPPPSSHIDSSLLSLSLVCPVILRGTHCWYPKDLKDFKQHLLR